MCIAKTSFKFPDIHDLHKCSKTDSVPKNSGSNLAVINSGSNSTEENTGSILAEKNTCLNSNNKNSGSNLVECKSRLEINCRKFGFEGYSEIFRHKDGTGIFEIR